MYRQFLLSITLLMTSFEAFAYYDSKGSYGDIANSMLGPVSGIAQMVQTAAVMCGVGLITGSFFKYQAYRRNPNAVTVGVPFVMMLTGIGCVILGFIHYKIA